MQQWKSGAHANTYGGNPLCCAAALVTLDLVEREYAANAEKVGAYFMDRLRELQSRHPVIGEVRGKGLMIGMELVSDRASRKPCKVFVSYRDHACISSRAALTLLWAEYGALHAAADGVGTRRWTRQSLCWRLP